ncbi:MAG: DUF2219 family protein, partial [Flavobacterium sp.]
MRTLLTFLLFLVASHLFGQVIDYSSTFKNTGNKYIRIHYDNDYFTKTDIYYSQGISLELATPSLKQSPINKILVSMGGSEYKYGLVLESFGYTPTTITSDTILTGDRPFSGNLSVTSYLSSTNSVKRQILTSAFTIGLMGTGAGGKEIQENIH